LWGYLKSKVYATKPRDLDDLRGRIIRALELTPPETYRNAVAAVYNRLAYCQAVESFGTIEYFGQADQL